MRAVIQRVSSASVTVAGERVAAIGRGLVVLVGVAHGDDVGSAERLARKIVSLRVFEDEEGKMNLALAEVSGQVLVVSNFTLYGDARRGNRPSFVNAARPEVAEPLVERLRCELDAEGGVFGAHMAVELVNDGPVTIVIEA